MQQQLTLNLNLEEANLILEALGNMPYGKVYAIVANIQQQAQKQLQSSDDNPQQVKANGAAGKTSSETEITEPLVS